MCGQHQAVFLYLECESSFEWKRKKRRQTRLQVTQNGWRGTPCFQGNIQVKALEANRMFHLWYCPTTLCINRYTSSAIHPHMGKPLFLKSCIMLSERTICIARLESPTRTMTSTEKQEHCIGGGLMVLVAHWNDPRLHQYSKWHTHPQQLPYGDVLCQNGRPSIYMFC